jgi:hypothetical protein
MNNFTNIREHLKYFLGMSIGPKEVFMRKSGGEKSLDPVTITEAALILSEKNIGKPEKNK